MTALFLALLVLLVLANVASIWYTSRLDGRIEELLERLEPEEGEQIGFRSETAPPPEEEENLPETEYVPPGPNIYEEKRRK